MYHHCARGPSRLLWFFIGAATASWWMKHHDGAQHFRVRHCARHQIPQESYPAPPSASTVNNGSVPPYHEHPQSQGQAQLPSHQAVVATAAAPIPPSVPTSPATQQQQHQQHQREPPVDWSSDWKKDWTWSWNSGWQSPSPSPPPPIEKWETDRQKMETLGKQAQDTLTDISEATLDTVMSTVETLKAKLAEHRAEKERQTREIQAMREEQLRQFEEWKKQQPPRHIV